MTCDKLRFIWRYSNSYSKVDASLRPYGDPTQVDTSTQSVVGVHTCLTLKWLSRATTCDSLWQGLSLEGICNLPSSNRITWSSTWSNCFSQLYHNRAILTCLKPDFPVFVFQSQVSEHWQQLVDVVDFALALRDKLESINQECFNNFVLRVGE